MTLEKLGFIISIIAIPCSIGLIILYGPTYIINLIAASSYVAYYLLTN